MEFIFFVRALFSECSLPLARAQGAQASLEKNNHRQKGSITLAVVLGMFLLSSIWGGLYAIHRYYVEKNQAELTRFTKKWSRLEKKYQSNKQYLKK